MQAGIQREAATDPPKDRAIPEAFEKIFREHHEMVFRTAFRITGHTMDAEDVLQTVFLRLMRRAESPDLSGGAQGYLHRAAINAALDVVRRRARTVALEEASWRALPDSHPGPHEQHRSAELRAQLRRALADVSPKAAEIFVLRFLEGYSHTAIARITGTSQATVAVLLFRTRRRLRKEFRSFLGEPL